MPAPFLTNVAVSTPFNNSINGFVATDVQTAIEEAKSSAEGKVRYNATCGFDGNASSGRYLEFITNISSSLTPFVIAEKSYLKSISIGTNGNSTTTVTIYKNGVALETIATSGTSKNNKKNLTHILNELDGISASVTSGSSSRPMVFLFFQIF